jgi:hypothetical protein
MSELEIFSKTFLIEIVLYLKINSFLQRFPYKRRTIFETMMLMLKYFRHWNRVLCLILTLYTVGIGFGNSNDAYMCWRKMLIEDCFCSAPWRMCISTSEFGEREQTKKICFETRVSIEIFSDKFNYLYLFPLFKYK